MTNIITSRAREGEDLEKVISQFGQPLEGYELRLQLMGYGSDYLLPDQIARKKKSIKRLQKEGIPWVDFINAPFSIVDVTLLSTHELATRTLCMLACVVKSYGVDPDVVSSVIQKANLTDDDFDSDQLHFIKNENPSDHDMNRYAAHLDSVWSMFWVLGVIDGMGSHKTSCSDEHIRVIKEVMQKASLYTATPRSMREILDEMDILCRYRWAVMEAREDDLAMPGGLSHDACVFRSEPFFWIFQGILNRPTLEPTAIDHLNQQLQDEHD